MTRMPRTLAAAVIMAVLPSPAVQAVCLRGAGASTLPKTFPKLKGEALKEMIAFANQVLL